MKTKFRLIAIALVMAFAAFRSEATPYASAITNNAGTVSFILNEAADNVKVVFDGGASVLDLGSRTKGAHSFPLGGYTSYEIRVKKTSTPGWTMISDDLNPLVRFYSPRGVAVNNYPTNLQTFGRIYVANGIAGTSTAAPTNSNRATGDGIYILNPDLTDAFGRGATVSTAGINFTPATQAGNTPWRIEVGPDGRLYIADYSTQTGTIFRTDPAVTTHEIVLQGQGSTANPSVHTTIGSLIIRGTLENSDLVIFGNDGNFPGNFNKVMRWDIGGTLPHNSAPTILGSVYNTVAQLQTDLDIGPDGKFYTLVNRFDGTDVNGIRVYDTDGITQLFGSRDDWGSPDPLRQARGLRVSPDGKKLVIIRDDNKIWTMSLANGIPDPLTTNLFDAFGGTAGVGRDVTFDVAGNLYAVSSGQEKMRVFSPGGSTETVTRSDGTFEMVQPQMTISVTATDDLAEETGGNTAQFTITRGGSTASAVTVAYSVSGSASNGVDYVGLPGSVTIAAGATEAVVTVTPLDDSIAELVETVVLSLSAGTNYAVEAPIQATVNLLDTETPSVAISTVTTKMYERTASDSITFRLTRLGETNADLTVNLGYSGAINGVDFDGNTQVDIAAGVQTQTFAITSRDDSALEGNEAVTVSVLSGTGYGIDSTSPSANGTIIDDEVPVTGTLIYTNGFDDSLEAGNWTVRFGALNDIDDKRADFGYDYSAVGIPSLPNASGSFGLKLTVNKDEASANGAAGVNVYPNSLTLSGDYVVRFAMFMEGVNGLSTTEYALFGINHSGTKTNWTIQSSASGITGPSGGDGLWFKIGADASGFLGGSDFGLLTATNEATFPYVLAAAASSSFTEWFKAPPFRFGGAPANFISGATLTPNWVDVEVSQVAGVITLKMNNTTILGFTNNTPYTSGKLMFGYTDPFSSIAGGAGGDAAEGYVVYENLQVFQLQSQSQAPSIVASRIVGSNLQIDFSGATSDTPSAFAVEGKATITGTFGTEAGATISQLNPGAFRATIPVSGSARFYRIRR